jgi:hypothetical protein
MWRGLPPEQMTKWSVNAAHFRKSSTATSMAFFS